MKQVRKKLYQWSSLLLCFVLAASLLAAPAYADQTEKAVKLIRVGWYEDSYNITGKNGERSGYGYEFQQAVAAYTGWSYEYVKAGWSDLLEMMERGEIDLMSGVSYTEDRAQEMLFSDLPMGTEKYFLYADLSHTDISSSNLKTLNGKRIGLLEGSVQATQFFEWEEAHGLQLQYDFVSSLDDALQKVADQKLDCIISTETPIWVKQGMTAIATVGTSGIYFAINKDRPDLKDELDAAMRQMESDKPFYAEELYKRYLSSVSSPALSAEEQSWLAQHGAIRVGWVNGDNGFSTLNAQTGEFLGVLTDYIATAVDCFENQKLEFELVGFDTFEEELRALQEGKIDFIFHMTQDPYAGEQNGFALSNIVMAVNLAAVTPYGVFNENNENRVAVRKDNLLLKWYLSYNYPNWTTREYETLEKELDALNSGEVDCLIATPRQLTDYLEDSRLHSVFLTKADNVSFAVRRGDVTLLSILNKTLQNIPNSMLSGALSMYDNTARMYTFADFVKDNLVKVAVVCGTLFALILVIILCFLHRSRKAEAVAKQAAAKAQELNEKLQKSQDAMQVALQQAESANAAKTTFLNNVSHDIRTPMNAIVGLTTLMENEPGLSGKVHEYLGKLKSSSQHLLNLINDILDMNKIESGKTTLNAAPFTLAEQIAQVESVIRPQAQAKEQNFIIEYRGVHHRALIGDATRLQQVLLNILSNAVKYTGNGGCIEMDIEEVPREGHYARYRFTITDNGIGMSEEFQKHIYESFTRAENSVTNKVQGTGLGMAITKNIVDMMGGSIALQSQLGKGSRFEVMLEFKLNETAAPAREPRAEAPEAEEPILTGMHFLCAEDNDLNAEILQAMLELQGACCTICKNGAEIVEKFRTVKPGEYDAILMDVQMPQMNGYEATRAIRSGENPLGRTIPIIAMTANAFSEDVQKSYEAGMDSHLSKPVDIKVLEKTLRRFRVTPPPQIKDGKPLFQR